MWAKERHRLILSMLSASQQVSANDLAQMLNVSRETVRRDLLDLEESGQVSRVHGGAVLPEPRSEEPFGQDARLRQALSLSIDRNALNQVVFDGAFRIEARALEHTVPCFGYRVSEPDGITMIPEALAARGIRGRAVRTLIDEGRLRTDDGVVDGAELGGFGGPEHHRPGRQEFHEVVVGSVPEADPGALQPAGFEGNGLTIGGLGQDTGAALGVAHRQGNVEEGGHGRRLSGGGSDSRQPGPGSAAHAPLGQQDEQVRGVHEVIAIEIGRVAGVDRLSPEAAHQHIVLPADLPVAVDVRPAAATGIKLGV